MARYNTGSVASMRAHRRGYSLWAPARWPLAWTPPAPPVWFASWMRGRKVAADREARADGRSYHQYSRQTAELARPATRTRAALSPRKTSIAWHPPLKLEKFYCAPPSSIHHLFACARQSVAHRSADRW